MATSLLFGGVSLSNVSCNGGAESDVVLGLAAGAESETSSVLALGYVLFISIVSYSCFFLFFLKKKYREVFCSFQRYVR